MQLSSSEIYRAYQPSPCDLRIYLHFKGAPMGEPGAFEEVIRRLGDRHEKAHLATLQNVTDLSAGTLEERKRKTLEAVTAAAPILYQPVLITMAKIGARDCTLVGIPDLLIREGDGYVIRDVKMARRLTEKEHAEIFWQLRLYGLLLALVTGKPPVRLEVFGGASEIVPIDGAANGAVEEKLGQYVAVMLGAKPPFAPVGWTKCSGCGYHESCWKQAEGRNDVALVPKVDQNLARALHDLGIASYDDLLAKYDEWSLAKVQKPWGQKTQKVGKAAGDILRSARALQSGKSIAITAPEIPPGPNFVMFDLEGLPPHLDELEKIYLWGLKVYGDKPGAFTAATAGFGADGDREGWMEFLEQSAAIFKEHGNIPFVHWHHYERTKVKLYIERYGDPDGTAARVLENLFDLLPATQKSVALPLPSYSLKVVEKFVGFKRTQTEYGGDWAMAQYIEATETEDEQLRAKVLDDILKYNEEDLGATWAVLSWLQEYARTLQ
ncbi:MAG: TM0106 family RecB-like putative nuclease [Thermomicrobiales bacterium]